MSALLDVLRRRAANNSWSNLRLNRAVVQLSAADFLATNRTSFFPSFVETPPQLDEFFMGEELPLREEELRSLELPLR